MKNTLPISKIPEREAWEIGAAREALRMSPVLRLEQSWLETAESDFQPGSVKIGCSGTRLLILAELEDQWVHNPATQKNEPVFLRGDTFEMFLKAAHREDYWELHVTPDNVVLQLHFPRHIEVLGQEAKLAGRSFEMEPSLVWEAVFASQVRIRPGIWTVLAEIPLDIFGETDSGLILQANFARYDYLPGREKPVLSATAILGHPLTFHDQRGWSLLRISLPGREAAASDSRATL